jgi:hypothetical protein
MAATTYDYEEETTEAYQSPEEKFSGAASPLNGTDRNGKVEKNKDLMPTCALLSFGVKGWLASGLKVESLLIDTKKSRGLGPDVKPYKGVKYLTVSRQGVELRC